MDIKFKVDGQKMKRMDNEDVVSDTANFLYATFDFSRDWTGINKVAQFTKRGDTYNVEIIKNRCLIPWEVLRGVDHFFISVFGGDLLTSSKVLVYVRESGYVEDGNFPADPTPSYFANIEAHEQARQENENQRIQNEILRQQNEVLREEAINNILEDVRYIHDQQVTSSVWDITHNLEKYPSVTIIDSASELIKGKIEYLSSNRLRVTFSVGISGKAYLN